MTKRNLTSTFYAPDKITVVNPDTGRKVECQVIEYNTNRITAAIQGNKLLLTRNRNGIFEGRLAGMTLFYTEK
jgi:hypothetical protein